MSPDDWDYLNKRPLFMEIPDDIGRSDPFDGPPGFLLGDMGQPSKLELSEQYFDAANQLIENIQKQRCEDYRLVYPVLFLYRHALELMLKGSICNKSNHHKLNNLADDYAKYIQEEFKQSVPSWVMKRIKEFAAIDPNSMAFRYAEDKYKDEPGISPIDDDIYVDVMHLKRVMDVLYQALVKASKIMRAQT